MTSLTSRRAVDAPSTDRDGRRSASDGQSSLTDF
jgi:hypothetical protein